MLPIKDDRKSLSKKGRTLRSQTFSFQYIYTSEENLPIRDKIPGPNLYITYIEPLIRDHPR